MRTVTMKELNALLDAIGLVRATSARLGSMCKAIPVIMESNDPAEALGFGIKGAQAITAEAERMFQQFERAANNFLGEGRRPEETYADFFSRICAMSQDEILAAPARNGLRLRL